MQDLCRTTVYRETLISEPSRAQLVLHGYERREKLAHPPRATPHTLFVWLQSRIATAARITSRISATTLLASVKPCSRPAAVPPR